MDFESIHYAINLDAVSSFMVFSVFYFMFLVTPRPERVYGMCNRMCTKGFLNYFSAIIEFLEVVLRVKF